MTIKYEAVIGLEVHAQLRTVSKLFCACSTRFGADPNTQVCPLCLGLPGTLPAINKQAVDYAVLMALAVGCKINERSVFARKNYFYPDLPKGYQISQYTEPYCEHGQLDIETDGVAKRIGITRIHMEEDAGKLLHGEGPSDANFSFVDLNRAGVPLIEIVSEPDIRSADEAVAYLKGLHEILVYLRICDGNMEEGSFRCDANVSVRPVGQEKLGTRAELKNINSFKYVKDAICYEIDRQIDLIDGGGKVILETRLFDSARGVTVSMRSKEEAHDYRYFPEPDLQPLIIQSAQIARLKETMPELPAAKRDRFIAAYSIPAYDAGVLTASRAMADYYEAVVKELYEIVNDSTKWGSSYDVNGVATRSLVLRYPNVESVAKKASNWVMGEVMAVLKETGKEITEFNISAKTLAELIAMEMTDKINMKTAKEVFGEMLSTGKSAAELVKAKGHAQISDEGELTRIIDVVIAANPDNLARYKSGKDKLFGFFVGETMKATKGQGNPALVNKILKERLG